MASCVIFVRRLCTQREGECSDKPTPINCIYMASLCNQRVILHSAAIADRIVYYCLSSFETYFMESSWSVPDWLVLYLLQNCVVHVGGASCQSDIFKLLIYQILLLANFSLQRHQRMLHSALARSFTCTECMHTFKSKKDLQVAYVDVYIIKYA